MKTKSRKGNNSETKKAPPLSHKDVFKFDVYRIQEFIDKFELPIKQNAVVYNIEVGYIDYVRVGRERLVVMTKKTINWVDKKVANGAVYGNS